MSQKSSWPHQALLGFLLINTVGAVLLQADEPPKKVCGSCLVPADPAERAGYIENSTALEPVSVEDLAKRSMLKGPQAKKMNFAVGELVDCTFREPDTDNPPNGKTPKLKCDIMVDGKPVDVKVKYQTREERNDGIWGEILTTRLFWKLGFPADTILPVRINCKNCPPKPWLYTNAYLNKHFKLHPKCEYDKAPEKLTPEEIKKLSRPARKCFEEREALFAARSDYLIEDAVIETKFKARAVEITADQGWSWDEYDMLTNDPAKRDSVQAERDALALLAAFVQHADNKAEQQRLICFEDDGKKGPDGKPAPDAKCLRPGLMIQDVGFTFGQGHVTVDDSAPKEEKHRARLLGTASVEGFAAAPVWSDKANCVTHIQHYSFTGMRASRKVSEAGRKLLAERLQLLTENDIRELFMAARIERRGETVKTESGARPVSPEDWIPAFQKKVGEIVGHSCPPPQ